MLCRLQSRDGKKAMIVHAKLSEMARLQATGKAKAQQRARAWELGCSWLCVVLWWLRVREKLWRGTTVLDCRSSLRAFLAALPSIRRSLELDLLTLVYHAVCICISMHCSSVVAAYIASILDHPQSFPSVI